MCCQREEALGERQTRSVQGGHQASDTLCELLSWRCGGDEDQAARSGFWFADVGVAFISLLDMFEVSLQ